MTPRGRSYDAVGWLILHGHASSEDVPFLSACLQWPPCVCRLHWRSERWARRGLSRQHQNSIRTSSVVASTARRAREYYLKGITKRICCHMLVRPFSDSSVHVAYRLAQGRIYKRVAVAYRGRRFYKQMCSECHGVDIFVR